MIDYVPGDSFLHRLHPGTLLVFELVVLVVAWRLSDPLWLAALVVLMLAVLRWTGVPLRAQRQHLTVIGFVGLIFILTQGIWYTSFGTLGEVGGGTVLFHLWPSILPGGPAVPFVAEGALYGAGLALRFAAIAIAFPVLVITTHPGDLVAALSAVRVGRRRLPPNLIFVLTTALRYVPTMTTRFAQTRDAQRARGIEFDGVNPVRRVRASLAIVLPVLVSSLIRAQDLTLVLETRAFGAGPTRTCLREVRAATTDKVVVAVLVALAAAVVVLGQTHGLGRSDLAP